ncbi:MAG: N-acetyltransferase [Bacteriovoracaceae bacterium]|jgi:L-amino acid N-acyltransferase YncA|nr:N-acetyltransferase [Bacteriovoracaceae bacterium]
MKIVPIEDQYIERCLEIYSPYISNSHISFENKVPSLSEYRMRVKKYSAQYPWIVAIESGQVLGFAYGAEFKQRQAYQWSVETSIYLSENAKGRGVAGKLYDSLFDYLDKAGYYNAFAGIALPGDISVAFHEKFGFNKVAHFKNVGYKNEKWVDVGLWQKEIKKISDQSSPLAPYSFSDLLP